MENMPERKFSTVERTREIGHQLHELRVGRGLSLREVAREAGCAASFLSQVEKGRSSPSLETLERIAGAFKLTVVELLNLARERGATIVLREGAQGQTFSTWTGGVLRHLLPFHVPATMSLLLLELKPRGRTAKRTSHQAMKELGVVLCGEVDCDVGGVRHHLNPGEAIYFDLISPHFWQNTGSTPARVLLVNPNFTQVFDLTTPAVKTPRPQKSGKKSAS